MAGMVIDLDQLVNDPRFQPFHGWHDDHRGKDRTPEYRPAIQQNRSEFLAFAEVLQTNGIKGKCLQLGLGTPGASHFVFQHLFDAVLTVDIGQTAVDDYKRRMPNDYRYLKVGDTHNSHTVSFCKAWAIFDLLFIDAGHRLYDVASDYFDYRSLVRPGGIIAFHDSLKRPTYENEIEVWRFVDHLQRDRGIKITNIGDEIGIAFTIVENHG